MTVVDRGSPAGDGVDCLRPGRGGPMLSIARTLLIAALVAFGGPACGGGGGDDPGADARADVPRDTAADGIGDAADPGSRDVPADGAIDRGAGDVGADVGPDAKTPDDLLAADPGTDEGPRDVAPADPGNDPGPPVDPFCHSFDDCADDEVCEFSLGQCQRRSTWTDTEIGLHAFHPAAAAPGDMLVIDGKAFYIPTFLGGSARVRIGNVQLAGVTLPADENRMVVRVTSAMAGAITVYDANGKFASVPGPFLQAPKGVIPCDDTTPRSTGVPGDSPRHAGPYAAGYVDLGDDLTTRVFYPALCGSIRRPPVPGTWPLVMILHGNGALWMNHEHLAQLLATWGFVSVMPATMNNMANEEQAALVQQVMPLVQRVRGKDLGGENAVLAGVVTTEDVAWVGHSRGTGRSEELIDADADLAAHTKGAIFLGPVDDGLPIPGLLMVFGAGHDAQSGSGNYNAPYDDHDGPKWLVFLPGGNHGSFCDDKVYGYGGIGAMFGDAKPDISRHRQLAVVETFGLPLMQRAFGVDEPFAAVLDTPPSDPAYTVKHQD